MAPTLCAAVFTGDLSFGGRGMHSIKSFMSEVKWVDTPESISHKGPIFPTIFPLHLEQRAKEFPCSQTKSDIVSTGRAVLDVPAVHLSVPSLLRGWCDTVRQ
jgi:hypothetical protein